MKKFYIPILLFSFVSVIYFNGCKDTVAGSEDIDSIIIPSSNVSFSEYIQPVFFVKCATSGCHDDGNRAGGLSLTSWANTVLDFSIVAPGLPNDSKLIWSIEGTSVNAMPPPGYVRPLTPNQIQGIRIWVAEGAKNN